MTDQERPHKNALCDLLMKEGFDGRQDADAVARTCSLTDLAVELGRKDSLACALAWYANATSDIVAALRTRRKPAPDPVSGQKPKSTWKTILGLAVGLGVVLLAAFAAVSVPPYGDLGPSPGSGDSAI